MQPRIVDGKYEIVRELRSGGMGAVYEARHLLTNRKVALKLILAETLARQRAQDALRRFEREARAAGSIESRHVVSVLDTGVDPVTSDNYIVMELLSGEDLRELLSRAGRLPSELVLSMGLQVCRGLQRAHERGVIHRDIKAGNIFLARRDDGEVDVKILDFGIAKLRDDPLASRDGNELTRSGSMLGSPLYMSPEQAVGSREIDARTDLWSLGVVMYEALAGATPHGNRALGGMILAICSEPAPPLRERAPWVAPELAVLVHRALALEPAQRFGSAEEMRGAIEELLPNGAAIRASALDALSAIADVSGQRRDVSPDEGAESAALTTVDAVTYGSGAKSSVAPHSRLPRILLALGAVGAVAVGVAVARRPEAPSASASATTPSVVPATLRASVAESPAPSTQHGQSAAVPATSVASPLAPWAATKSLTARRSPRPTPGAPPSPSASSRAESPMPASTGLPVANEPAIDRHFD